MARGKFVFVVNPRSANGATLRRFERVREKFDAALHGIEVRLTERPRHATELARAAVRDGAKCVVSVGGDGTNNEVVNGFFDEQGELIESGTAFGVVTSGTGGDFRRTFKWTIDPLDDLARLARFETKLVDAGRVRFTGEDGREQVRAFINIATAGVAGAVVDVVNNSSKALGAKVSFLAGSVRAMVSYRPLPVRLSIDDGPTRALDATLVAVANGQYFGGGMWIAPDALPFDGQFHVVTIEGGGPAFWARHGLKLYAGSHVSLPACEVRTGRKVRIEPGSDAPVLVEMDGEQPGRLPAVYELVPAAIPLVV